LAALRGMALPFIYNKDLSQRELWAELVRAWSTDGFLVPPLQHGDSVVAAAFDPTGERVVTASDDNTARIWDARTGAPIGKPLQHRDSVNAAAFDPTAERVVTASDDHTARIWDARTGEPIGTRSRLRFNTSISSGAPPNVTDSSRGSRPASSAMSVWSSAREIEVLLVLQRLTG
jgi:WD40 repeat protein